MGFDQKLDAFVGKIKKAYELLMKLIGNF